VLLGIGRNRWTTAARLLIQHPSSGIANIQLQLAPVNCHFYAIISSNRAAYYPSRMARWRALQLGSCYHIANCRLPLRWLATAWSLHILSTYASRLCITILAPLALLVSTLLPLGMDLTPAVDASAAVRSRRRPPNLPQRRSVFCVRVRRRSEAAQQCATQEKCARLLLLVGRRAPTFTVHNRNRCQLKVQPDPDQSSDITELKASRPRR
jgi:hypothetical protein